MATGSGTTAAHDAIVVINLRSRLGADVAQCASQELERQGIRVRASHLARTGQQLLSAVREAADSGVDYLVIGGGDGTLSTTVDLLANSAHMVIGLLPIGTGNEVATALGIPMDLARACGVIASGRTVAIDLAQASGDYFLHTALIGYAARANHTIPSWLKRRLGKAAYLCPFLATLIGSRTFHATITTEEGSHEIDTKLVLGGNGGLHLPGKILLPSSQWDEKKLVVYTPRDTHWSTSLQLVTGLWLTHRPQPDLLRFASTEYVTVTTVPPQPMDLDGEMANPTPGEFRIARSALRVRVPQ